MGTVYQPLDIESSPELEAANSDVKVENGYEEDFTLMLVEEGEIVESGAIRTKTNPPTREARPSVLSRKADIPTASKKICFKKTTYTCKAYAKS